MNSLTDYQNMQLRSIYFSGELEYKNEKGNRVPREAWVKMIDAIVKGGYAVTTKYGWSLTQKGKEYLDRLHNTVNK